MRLRVLAGTVVLVLLHFTFHVGFGWGRAAPDLLTLGLLLMARELAMGWAALTGFALGVLEDALSVLAFGANTLAMAVVGMLGALSRNLFLGDSRLFAVSYFFAGKWLRDLIQWLAVGEELREPFVSSMLVDAGLASVYVAFVGLVALAVLGVSWDSAEIR
jgi:rod shape-determining protein MreD